MPRSSIASSVAFWVWMLCTVNRHGIPIRRAAAGISPVIQSLQWIRSGSTTGMMLLITSRWKAIACRKLSSE